MERQTSVEYRPGADVAEHYLLAHPPGYRKTLKYLKHRLFSICRNLSYTGSGGHPIPVQQYGSHDCNTENC